MSFKKVIQVIGYPIIRVLYRIRISGIENFLKEGAFVLCPNHTSMMDVPVLYLAVKRPLNFMAKEELFRNKFLAWLFTKLGAFPVRRGEADLSAIKKALSVLKRGEVLAIFPQGTRTQDIEVEDAKAGAVLIASKAKAPVVPVSISGGYRLFSKIYIKFGKPYYFEEGKKLSGDEIKQVAEEIMTTIKNMAEDKDCDC